MSDSYLNHGIVVPKDKVSGEVTTKCPRCSDSRKKKNIKCLSVNLDQEVWICHHCGWKGKLKNISMQEKEYALPQWANTTTISEKVVKWFESRKISQSTIEKLKITEGIDYMPQRNKEVNTIHFNYFDGEILKNVKYRDSAKNFKLHKDAQLIPYNLNALKGANEVYLVEGEMDVCAMVESGVECVLSCPNGANLKTNKLEWLDYIIEDLADKVVHLAFDNDPAGRKLREDVADRIGREKCDYIEFLDCKDANDCLIIHGIDGIIRAINDKKNFPLEGVFTISDFSDSIDDMYNNGLDRGVSMNIENFDLNIVPGYLTTITGIPSHGKSEWVDNMALHLRMHHDWNGAFYSPENRPTELHFSKICRKLIGKHWDGPSRMTHNEKEMAKEYLNKKFWFLKPEKDFTIQTILNQVRELQWRYGLQFFVIDAWNKLEHREKEDSSYIGRVLDEIVMFCEIHRIHCFLVAHPTKMKKRDDGLFEIPDLYSISGSSNFYNKSDNGITVYRDFQMNMTKIVRTKVKFDHWGTEGTSEYKFDVPSKRYYVTAPDYSNWVTGRKPEVNSFVPNNEFLSDDDVPF